MQYVWLAWSLALVVVWFVIYILLKSRYDRRKMIVVSLGTALLGLTEPLFVPEYWSPPSLFDLALRTGFDLESLIFSFGIGGIVVVLYDLVFRHREVAMSEPMKHDSRHRSHFWSIISAPVVFVVILLFSELNPIYAALIAMATGGLAAWYCRPDLRVKMFVSAGLFLGLYFIYFRALIATVPNYVEQVWNLSAISGILIWGIPVEELLFALMFGFLWGSIYEHLAWRRVLGWR